MLFNHGLSRTGFANARPGRARTPAAPHWLVAVCTLFAINAIAANPAITVSAQQRYPWNGLVDLHFTITGDAGTQYATSFTAKDMVCNTNITMRTICKADGTAAAATERLLPGTYSWVWDTAADLPKGFKCNRVRVAGTVIDAFPYSVKFNANGGSGTMANESFTYGTAKALTANAFTRTGYTFQGWATSASGAKVYSDKQSVSNLTATAGAVVNLYAVWDHSKVQLWAGGPYWATMNIGAAKPEEDGYKFWWGDVIGYKLENYSWVASDGSGSTFSFNSVNTPTHNHGLSYLQSHGWITSGNVLAQAHDAAHVKWGGSWRMPTRQEFVSLIDKCTWTWTTKNGVSGYLVRGKGDYASSSIFLPPSLYWSSVPRDDYFTYFLYFYQGQRYVLSNESYVSNSCIYRYDGLKIRPVQSAAK